MTAKEKAKQIKCYCGHTTYCDCGSLEEASKNETKICINEREKQTAVEWLREIYDSCNNYEKFIANIDWEQAKEMEKEQIIDFAYVIADDLACGVFRDKKSMEERYNEFLTFRSEEDDNIQ